MELDEGVLRERFDRALSGLAPDVVALVDGGQSRGVAMRRRRRVVSGIGVAAAAAVTVGAVALGQGLIDHESTGPTDPSPTGVEQLEPATPRGLAAAVIDQLGRGEPVVAGGERPSSDGETSEDQLQVALGYAIGDAQVELQIYTTSDVRAWRDVSCDQPDPNGVTTVSCEDAPLSDGTPALRALVRAARPDANGLLTYQGVAAVQRADQVVSIAETVRIRPGSSTRYTEATLPIPVGELLALATSPSVGFSTTAQYNDAGEQIEDFRDSTTSSGSGSSSGASEVTTSVNVEPVQPSTAGSN